MSLKPQHKKVVDGYMRGLTKKAAMLEAGYSDSTATTRPSDVFGREDVKNEIQRRGNLSAVRSDIDLDWIVSRLKDIADANIGDALNIYSDGSARIDLNKLTPELKRAMSKFSSDVYTEGRGPNSQDITKMKVDFGDKIKALDMLARILGLSKEKQNIEISVEEDAVAALMRGRSRSGLGGGNE